MKQFKPILFTTILSAVFLLGGSASFIDANSHLPVPKLTSPAPGDQFTEAEIPVTLKWEAERPSGGGYLIKLSTPFTQQEKIWTRSNSYTIPQTLIVGTSYSWTVQTCTTSGVPAAQDEADDCSSLSDVWQFSPTLAQAKLVSPANTVEETFPMNEDGSVTLDWEDVDGVSGTHRYNVQLNQTTGNARSTTFNEGITISSFKIPAGFINPDEKYSWWVTPVQANTLGPLSDSWVFLVSLPEIKPISPTDNETRIVPAGGESVTFEWKSGGEMIETYDFKLVRDNPAKEIEDIAIAVTEKEVSISPGIWSWEVIGCQTSPVKCNTWGPWEFIARSLPVIEEFKVDRNIVSTEDPNQGPLEFSYLVKADFFTGLRRVELWRKNIDTGEDWKLSQKENISGRSKEGFFVENVDSGIKTQYRYGLHVIDQEDNECTEGLSPCGHAVTFKTVFVNTISQTLDSSEQPSGQPESGSSGPSGQPSGQPESGSSGPSGQLPEGPTGEFAQIFPTEPSTKKPVVSSTPGACRLFCETRNPDDQPDGTTCICNPLRSANVTDIITNILTLLFNFALVLTPVMVVVAGTMFVTAGGDPGRISTAKSILLWTAVGLVIIVLARGLVAVLGGIIGF